MRLTSDGAGQWSGEIAEVEYLGADHRVRIRLDDGRLLVAIRPAHDPSVHRGERVGVQYDPGHLFRLPKGEA